MPRTKKTDNHNLSAKLAVRRYFLDKYHAGKPFSVFDACQGSGKLWQRLARDYQFDYWGVDVKEKSGRLKVDSVRLIGMGISEDVIDIDTYGSPWKHWIALLPILDRPVTVFLTLGQTTTGPGGSVGSDVLKAIGLEFPTLEVRPAFHVKLKTLFPAYCVARAQDFGLRAVEWIEAESDGNARYFGLRLEPVPELGIAG